jgi:hypothetical protein
MLNIRIDVPIVNGLTAKRGSGVDPSRLASGQFSGLI